MDPRSGLQSLLDALSDAGYRTVGPMVRDGVIVYDDVRNETELPLGRTVEQAPGRWRLAGDPGSDQRFSWTPGAESWKRFVFPARSEVLRIRRTDGSWANAGPRSADRPLALIGARDCELRALDILDRVMLDPAHPDNRYAARRSATFVVAVTCGEPGGTCWCTSMGGGPQPRERFDLRVTELPAAGDHGSSHAGGGAGGHADRYGHRLLVEAGSEAGRRVLQQVPGVPADEIDLRAAHAVVDRSVAMMPVRVNGPELPRLLAGSEHHPQWDVVAERCLSCGNCTMVCPTCFCSSFTDHTELGTHDAVREQSWVSCFELDHSLLGGRPVRATTAARYRQWLTHKLQTWPEQFGTSGCVGCGRCTTWCPAGIDIVEEVTALTGGRT